MSNWNYDINADQKIKVNYLLVLFSMGKLLVFIPHFMNTLKFKSPRTSRVCRIYNCDNSILYAVKCYFKESPIKLVIVLFFFSVSFFTFCYRIGERSPNNPDRTFNYIQNMVWLVIISMTGVGYGDYSPKTMVGRTIGVICIFWGIITVSIIVLVVVNTFELDQSIIIPVT